MVIDANDKKHRAQYVPSYDRKRKKVAHNLEYENADLRNRLEAMAKALESANYKLREISSWGGLIGMKCNELTRACSAVAGLSHAPLGTTSAALAVEVHARHQQMPRRTLFVASRRYARNSND
jgi:hypothetical protein